MSQAPTSSDAVDGNQGGRERCVASIVRNHGITKNKRCRYCDNAFSKTEHLLRHERSHTKENPFRCDVCSRVYRRRDTLLRHCRKHIEEGIQGQTEASLSQTMYKSSSDPKMNDELQINNNSIPPLQVNMDPGSGLLPDWQSGGPQSLTVTSSSQMNLDQECPEPTTPSMTGLDSGVVVSFHEQLNIPAFDTWESSKFTPDISWLNGYDFDLQALNTSVSAVVDISEPLFQPQPPVATINQAPHFDILSDSESKRKHLNNDVHRKWFYHLEWQEESGGNGLATGQTTPVNVGIRCNIGDDFRHGIFQRLRAHVNEEPLPSTNFLNLSARVYFTKFNLVFPVIHSQTFRPSPKNSLLLLSITSIGSLLLGTESAATQGTRIFERLNKAILASWEKILVSDKTEAVSMIQAALIGQTFGLLSGVSKHLAIVESFHGTIIAWARKCGMFKCQEKRPQLDDLFGSDLEEAWKAWARSEEIIRTVIGLYIHDAKLACMFHHEPFLRHNLVQIPAAADDDLFNAPNAVVWKEQMLSRSLQRSPMEDFFQLNTSRTTELSKPLRFKRNYFSAYFSLYTIAATIGERQQMQQLLPDSLEFTKSVDALMSWYHTFHNDVCRSEANLDSRPDSLCLMGLWHTVFMSLLVNFDLLERAVGRDSGDDASIDSAHTYAIKWANSRESVRCILHAKALLNSIGAMRLDAEPAIHIPHCLFLAGVASYCFALFRLSSPICHTQSENQSEHGANSVTQPDPVVKYHEFMLRGPVLFQHLFGILLETTTPTYTHPQGGNMDITEHMCIPNVTIELMPDTVSSMLRTVIDTLQRTGHWKIAHQYAQTLSTLAYTDEVEDAFLAEGC